MKGLVADRLRRLEDRLERLLAVGRRNAEADRAALSAEVPRLEALGFPELAGRARAVVEAEGEGFLLATTQALHFARLLRGRLVEPEVPPGAWKPLVTRRRSARSVDRVVPIGRAPLGEGEVWVCVKLYGSRTDWLLIEPWPDEVGSPWLRGVVVGYLQWRGRYPVGSSGEVTLAALSEPRQPQANGEGEHPLAVFLKALAMNKLTDGMPFLGFGKRIQVMQLAPDATAGCAWPDPRMAAAFAAVAREPVWVVAATDGATVTPLVVVNPPGFFESPRLVHLVEGNPSELIAFDEWEEE